MKAPRVNPHDYRNYNNDQKEQRKHWQKAKQRKDEYKCEYIPLGKGYQLRVAYGEEAKCSPQAPQLPVTYYTHLEVQLTKFRIWKPHTYHYPHDFNLEDYDHYFQIHPDTKQPYAPKLNAHVIKHLIKTIRTQTGYPLQAFNPWV